MTTGSDPSVPAGGAADAGRVSAEARRFHCATCGATLVFVPGTSTIACPYCGAANAIESAKEGAEVVVHEQDFDEAIARLEAEGETEEHLDVRCDACGAEVHGLGVTTSFSCPYCGANIVATARSRRLIKPGGVIPFKIDGREAGRLFGAWLKSLWFAPSEIRRAARTDHPPRGVYIPAWTIDCEAETTFTGQRGDAYYVTVPYTTTVNGRRVTRTRQERRIRWSSVSGRVENMFDDLLVIATRSLPEELLEELEPWELREVKPYVDAYLTGFAAESYQVDLRGAFEDARRQSVGPIQATIRARIGGDEQRITSMHPRYSRVTYKHLLLPVWMSAYRYRGKVYRFVVNARTGEVRGERPYSAWKIAGAVLLGLAAAGVIALVIAATRG